MRANPYDREIRRLALPALGSLTVEPLYVLVDTAIVGHLGTPQLGGLGVAGIVLTSMFAIFNFLAYSTTAAVARRFGAGQLREAAEQGVAGVWLGVCLGAVLAGLGLLFAAPIVDAMGASDVVRPYALTYLRISLIGVPAVMMVLVGTGYLRGLQDTAFPFVVLLASNALNLVVELVLVYGLDRGVAGSAWSTVVAQWTAAIVFVALIGRRARSVGAAMRPVGHEIRDAGKIGAMFSVRTGALLAALLAGTAVASRLGDAEVAAYQIAFQLWLLLVLSLDAIAIAGQAMVGKLLGAGDAAAARAAANRMLGWGVAVGVGLLVLVVVVRNPLVAVFTGDAQVRELAEQALIVVALLQPLGAVVFVLDGVLIGAGEARYLAGAMLVATFLVYAPLAMLVLAAHGTLWQLWTVLGVWVLARAVGNGVRFAGDRWQVTGSVRPT